ncbi:MAG: phosphoadenosine phosphosulfate reductase family protein [Oscillospiraceae bacterium]|nr:phosphoadenosine phosphosulfate reductase family protein [Oscillospiraceae bacterium]
MTRKEALAVAKPIRFNTEMVRAIQDNRKTVTRRLIKHPYYIDDEDVCRKSGLAMHVGINATDGMPYPDNPYKVGDILYVRETVAYVQYMDISGSESEFRKRYIKYKSLVNAPFITSSHCCDVMKKLPMRKYEAKTKRKPMIAVMAEESLMRQKSWLKNGCNAFEASHPASRPMSFWKQQDILLYLKTYNVPYCSVYGDIVEQDRQLKLSGFEEESPRLITTGCERTGCMFCMFGIMSDKTPNRFQRLKKTHPKIYDYCIGGGEFDESGLLKPNKQGLGIGRILDFIGIEY